MISVIVSGHVDHGKSTLTARLLEHTGALKEGHKSAIKTASEGRGRDVDLAFALDSFQAERDGRITIETSYRIIELGGKRIALIDAPGHVEFLKNMVTGATRADAAIVVISAEKGIEEQTRRHLHILHFLGVKKFLMVINKMDLFDQLEVFFEIRRECEKWINNLHIEAEFFPISALKNLGIKDSFSAQFSGSLLEGISNLSTGEVSQAPFRFPVQDVMFVEDRPILLGRVSSGRIGVGEEVLVSGGMTRVKEIHRWPQTLQCAEEGQSVGIEVDVSAKRGDILSCRLAPLTACAFEARVLWTGPGILTNGAYELRLSAQKFQGEILIQQVFDLRTLDSSNSTHVEPGSLVDVRVLTDTDVVFDLPEFGTALSRFVIFDEARIAGGGIIKGVS